MYQLTFYEWPDNVRELQNAVAALAQTGGNIFGSTGVAALPGMKPTTVISLLKALGFERNAGASCRPRSK